MSIAHKLLPVIYPPFNVIRELAAFSGLVSSDFVRVMIVHDVPPAQETNFEHQIERLSRKWNFISPVQFEKMISGEEPIVGRNLLLTFDDGFASNRIVAEKILNPRGILALFFIISDFADIDNRSEAREFISKQIQPGKSVVSLPPHLVNMRWNDLTALLEQGHTIGGHTATHARLSEVSARPILRSEIIESADKLEERLGIRVKHFAYTFGNISSFSLEALDVAAGRFDFVYSGLRGCNTILTSPKGIRRDAVDPGDSVRKISSLLTGAVDIVYRSPGQILDSWIKMLEKRNTIK